MLLLYPGLRSPLWGPTPDEVRLGLTSTPVDGLTSGQKHIVDYFTRVPAEFVSLCRGWKALSFTVPIAKPVQLSRSCITVFK